MGFVRPRAPGKSPSRAAGASTAWSGLFLSQQRPGLGASGGRRPRGSDQPRRARSWTMDFFKKRTNLSFQPVVPVFLQSVLTVLLFVFEFLSFLEARIIRALV